MSFERFWSSVFGQSIKWTAVALGLLTVVLVFTSMRVGLIAIWATCVWLFLNSYMMAKIYFAAQDGANAKSIAFNCMIKFPLLYLIGLLFVLIPGFKLEGVLVTLTIYMLLLGWTMARMSRLEKV